jgi:hypothetical protein
MPNIFPPKSPPPKKQVYFCTKTLDQISFYFTTQKENMTGTYLGKTIAQKTGWSSPKKALKSATMAHPIFRAPYTSVTAFVPAQDSFCFVTHPVA